MPCNGAGALDLPDCGAGGAGGGVCGVHEEVLSFTRRISGFAEGEVVQEFKAMNITQAILDELTAKAKESPRLRMNLDLRNGENDTSQRMLNAIEPGSVVPIHRHRNTSETVVCLRGKLVEEYYDDLERMCTESIVLTPNGQTVALNIPAGQWHTVKALESGTVILELKDGKYEPIGEEDILK